MNQPQSVPSSPNEITWVVKPRTYIYAPKKDITVHELARILPLFHMNPRQHARFIEGLPPEVKRHFEVK